MNTDKAMVTALEEIASMAGYQIGVPVDTEAAHEHAMIAQRMADVARAALSSLTLERGEAEPVAVVGIKTMKLSDGRTDYFVAIRCCDREVTPHVFREKYKAAYHVALYHWLLNGGSEPDLMAFSDNDFPAQYCFTSSTLSKRGEAEETPAKKQSEAILGLLDHPAPSPNVVGPIVSVKTMKLSDGRADYFVSIKVGNREVTPHVFRAEYKAAYHVALYSWLLNGTVKPDLMAFDEDDWPAQATEIHADVEGEIASVVQSVNEWDDRTSPDDYPDHLLITSDELADILRNFAETLGGRNDG